MTEIYGVERAVARIGLVALAVGCIAVILPFATSLVWGAIITYSSWPLFLRLKRVLRDRTLPAAFLMILITASILVAPIFVVVTSFAENAAGLLGLLRHWLEIGPPGPPEWLIDLPLIGAPLSDRWLHFSQDRTTLSGALTPYLGTLREAVLAFGGILGAGLGKLLLSLLIALVLYCQGDALVIRMERLLWRIGGEAAVRLTDVAGNTVRSVVFGVFGTNLILAILAATGFVVAGIPGGMLLGLLCFFLTMIPVGPTFAWLPASIWLFSNGDTGWAIFLIAWNVVIFNVLEGAMRIYLIGRGSRLPLIVVLFGMLGGLLMFGLLGLFVGPTLLAIGYVLLDGWTAEDRRPHLPTGNTGP